MKTIEELIKKIDNSDEMKKELEAVSDKNGLEEFLKKYDCGANAEDFVKTVESLSEGEISDESAEAAAGGIASNSDDETPLWTKIHLSPL